MSRTARFGRRFAACWLPFVCLCLLASAAVAQDKPPAGSMSAEEKAMMDAMMKAGEPGPNHQLLASFAGDWTFKSRMWMNPAAPPSEGTGTASYATLFGGRYLEAQYRGDMMGMPFEGRGLMGYDNISRKFQATWADNMSTMIMVMTGQHDPAAKSLTYTATMDDIMKPGTKVDVRQVIRLASPNSQVMEWYETRGGKETKTMEITFTRK